MPKRKKQSKLPKHAKLRRGNSAKRSKPRKIAKSAAAKRPVARANPKRATVKKVARKVKQPVVPVIDTAAIEVIEQPAPEVEQTEVRKAS
jgi:hypothetical protein